MKGVQCKEGKTWYSALTSVSIEMLVLSFTDGLTSLFEFFVVVCFKSKKVLFRRKFQKNNSFPIWNIR